MHIVCALFAVVWIDDSDGAGRFCYSADGTRCAILTDKQIHIINTATAKVVCALVCAMQIACVLVVIIITIWYFYFVFFSFQFSVL